MLRCRLKCAWCDGECHSRSESRGFESRQRQNVMVEMVNGVVAILIGPLKVKKILIRIHHKQKHWT